MPTLVEESLVEKYLGKGYTETRRDTPSPKAKEKPVEPPVVCVDLDFFNYLDEKDLVKVRGIGPALATKIIESRPYESIDALKEASPRTNWSVILEQPMP